MKLRTLTKRSLRFHWRSHLGVVLGAAIGSAALIGALIVGDSVKGSLRVSAFNRLGDAELALDARDRFVGEHINVSSRQVVSASVLQARGTASRNDGEARVNQVQILGVDESFYALGNATDADAIRTGLQPGLFSQLPPDTALINAALANHLKIPVGDTILLRVRKPAALASEAVISSKSDVTVAMRLKVAGVWGADQPLGQFELQPTTSPPLNVFVPLNYLQKQLDKPAQANLVIVSGETAPLANSQLASLWTLADAETYLTFQDSAGIAELRTPRVFLDPPVVRSALAADSNAQPILTYLANLISVGSNATPYSMITAAGAPWTPPDLRDDEIILNQWLAEDLQAKPGDALTLIYFDPESGARLTERTNTFRVHSIVPMQMPWADRTLMPQFPGIEKAETTAEWDTAFPLVHKIRPQDDDYWRDHRGTPKAFITLAAGQKMWANRFGNLTAIRFPIPTNFVAQASQPAGSGGIPAASSEHRAGMPGEPAAKDGRATAETFRAALEKKILASLKPEELGLRFEPVREQALKAAEQSQDFGGLFIGFSLFVIVAALLLMAMLFQFSLEQRGAEIGTLLALGFTPKRVRRLFLREGAALAFIGGLIGTLGGIAYARAMLLGLTTLWRDAVGASSLRFFVTTQTLLVGLFASTLVAVFTLWLALRKQAKQPARALLAGEDAGLENAESATECKQGIFLGGGAVIGAFILIVGMFIRGDTANVGAFFAAGALVLAGGLCLLSAGLTRRASTASILHPPSMRTMALRGLARRRSRSVATVAMLASATFLIVSISLFRLDANRDATKRKSGTGGFALIGESTMPVVADLNAKAGRESFALKETDFENVNFVQFRVRAGDEASCLNLNRAQKPRLLGVGPWAVAGRFTFTKSLNDEMEKDGPWVTLKRVHLSPPLDKDEVPAIGDAASIQWAMGKKVGDTLDYVDERGQPFKVRIVGAVANSILQGQLIIDEAEFVKRFPSESGYKYFLVDAPTNRVADVSAKLSRALQDVGLELTPAPQRLAQFNAVQNTYLGTFQILGGLGLLLGSAGLGIVVLRNVLERRGELALLLAVGWQRNAVNRLVLREHLALLGLGLGVGVVAAIVAVLPALLTPGAEFPWLTLGLTLAAVLANGVLWTWLATRVALRGELLAALRGE